MLPLLAERCFLCHGPDEESRESGLRLDTRRGALDGGVFPGDPDASPIIRRVTSKDPDLQMPPPGSGKNPLTAAEISLLQDWIEKGANYELHWSFRPPERPKIPGSNFSRRARSAIDHFVWARLDQKGLTPAPPADRHILIRRVTLDLTGLPPSIEEVDAFVNDQAPDAYEKLVDRLLASPQYGERWALWWLDLARYADSNGYESDRSRSIWSWRDWIINALNIDMPFDQFTIEQIAGDMLPDATPAQRIATGFHRNTWINEEGGHDWEQFRYESVVDRVHTTSTVFLGLTMACAQCHDHKYDPISQREYWQLFAFLNNADEPDFWVSDPKIRERQQQIDAEVARRIADRAAKFPPLDPATTTSTDQESRQQHLKTKFRAWLQDPSNRPIHWTLLDPRSAKSAGNATMTELDDHSILVTGDRPEVDSYQIVYELNSPRVTGFRLEALPDARLPNYGPGRGSFNGDGAFVITEFQVDVVGLAPSPAVDSALGTKPRPNPTQQRLEFVHAYASYKEQEISHSIDGNKLTHWFIAGGAGQRHVAVFETKGPQEFPAGTRIRVTIPQNFVHQQTLGRFRLFVTGTPGPLHPNPRPTSIDLLLLKDPEARTEEDQISLQDYYLSIAPELESYNDEIQKLQASRPRFPTTFIFKERKQKDKRATHIHVRGEYRRPADVVSAAVPAVLHPLAADAPRNRLTLAKWLVDEQNPLVARVIANQLWQSFFGQGIVSTSENFGVQGAPPTHRQLLDWLAVELRQGGWSLKSLQRQIVMSSVYRQSSRITPELAQRDPQNVLLARGPRLRVDAETIRDIALEASGLLVDTVGGPSVFPPQPAEAGETFGGFKWKPSTGTDRYRRGLYTFRKRGGPYAAFATFDAPAPNTCTVSRGRSNTPLQALTQLNDLVVLEASKAMARRVLRNFPNSAADGVRRAWRLALSRPPTESELTALIEFHERQLQRFEEGSLNAEAIYGATANDDEQLRALAAMTTVARLLLNLDETITKE